MGEIVNVKEIVESKKVELKRRIENLKEKRIFPKLALILANDDKASRVYVGNKRKLCHELGVLEEEYTFDENVVEEELINVIKKLNKDDSVDGILVQLPLYNHLNESKILDCISPNKDVDGFHPLNLGKLMIGEKTTVSCTPKGVMTILESLNVNLSGKDAVIVGRSRIVGKPMAQLLLSKNATVTTCHSKTKDLKEYTKKADILVVAVGVPHLIKKDMVKEGAIVLDVGINRIDGKLQGDVDTQDVLEKVEYITSVPGGVGLTTVISLMENLIEIAERR
ncbi:MAG: bifunctional 5,10-methylenetetrahydrofolate dehydrogenase/5,10-methenyltetrahydrofolate cyclohydrolase [Clostridia bacterium]|nr:bifunctional 5,10-methylenetetrahydrofolate dehydrogenase/5,10-methenyltetrahydrofolate cyclohydrolase [Clostridia bacterium]